ncbi:MAG TPA: arylesterase, partial [Pseudolabrys sp.]|nr:arylesterase [Pseudolabrys sp.]
MLRALAALLALSLTTTAAAAPVKIVALGDSATAGWLVAKTDAYPAELERKLRAKGLDVDVRNAGVS